MRDTLFFFFIRILFYRARLNIMLFLTNEPAKKTEINDFDGTRYNRAWVLGTMGGHIGGI